MPPEPTPLTSAASRKSQHAQIRAHDALRELDQQGAAITFQAVARQAGVSRQWLYQQPELRKEIERLRDRRVADTQPRVPEAHRASTASLRQRLENLRAENRGLREQVAELKAELAIAYGQRRAAALTTPPLPRPRAGPSLNTGPARCVRNACRRDSAAPTEAGLRGSRLRRRRTPGSRPQQSPALTAAA